MSSTEGAQYDLGALPPQVKDLYRRVLRREPIEDDAPGIEQAIRLGILVPDGDEKNRYRAAEPGRVIASLVSGGTQRIAETSRFLAKLPGMREELNEVYGDVRTPGVSGTIEHLHGNKAINERLDEVLDGARKELITAQPGGPRTKEILDRSLGRDTAALARGVQMRTLYHATARHHTLTQEWAEVMASKGGEVRTLDAPFLKLILVDRNHAFIQDCLERDPYEPPNAWAHLINDAAVCAYLAELFERDWNRADYWHGSGAGDEGALTTRMQRAILRLLSSGRTQDQAARDLGLSTRTLQKHLTAIRTKVPHLRTVPQMTYWWGTCPDRNLD